MVIAFGVGTGEPLMRVPLALPLRLPVTFSVAVIPKLGAFPVLFREEAVTSHSYFSLEVILD